MTRLLIPLLITFGLLFDCEPVYSQQQDTVARIADKYTISYPELAQYAKDYMYYYRYHKNIVEASDTALADMIVNRMKIIDFFERGFNEKRELLEGMMRTLNEELVIEYYNKQFYQKYVNEDAVRKAYTQFGKEVIYREIILRIPKNASLKTIDSLRSFANKIKLKLDSGEDFSRLAERYSQDAESSSKGGLMPPVTWKMAIAWAGYDTVFHLAINHPKMVESQEAFHIVRADKIDTVGVPPYSQAKEDIRKALNEKYMYVASNEFDQAKKNLLNERKLQWNEKGVEQLLRWSNIPQFYDSGYSDTLSHAISHGNNFLILKYSKGKVDVKEFLRLVKEVLTLRNAAGIKEDEFKQFILEAVRTDKIVKKARELGLVKDILNPETKDPALMNWIIRIYYEQVIEKQVPPATEEALKAFYRANMNSLYYQLARVNIYAVIDSSRSTVEEAKKKLEQGVPFNKLASTIFVKTFVRTRDGKIVSYFSIEPPYLGEAAFKLNLDEVAGPIEYHDSASGIQYALIKCMEKRGEKQLTYDDVKNSIANDFADYYRNKIAQSVAEELKRKYPVTIYEDVLRQYLLPGGVTSSQR